jgi:hypothetical protein
MDLLGQLDLRGSTGLEQVERPPGVVVVRPHAVGVLGVAPVAGQVPGLAGADGRDLQIHSDVVAAHGGHFQAQLDPVFLLDGELQGGRAAASRRQRL